MRDWREPDVSKPYPPKFNPNRGSPNGVFVVIWVAILAFLVLAALCIVAALSRAVLP